MSFEISDKFADYEVIAVLGTGGMGRVYKVRNTLSNRFEAMKVLLPDVSGAADQSERFLREIRVHATLDHPNIAGLRTALRVDNQIVMIMELVDGTTLQAMLERGPLPFKSALNYVNQALEALSYAHQQGVIHRDIKPANIMVTADGTVKLMDFGIAKRDVDRSLTTTGTAIGSIHYMSPEQVKGSGTLDGRSDLYSLGMTLYLAVTGKRPFNATQDYAIFNAHLSEPPIPPVERNPRVPPQLNQAILKSLAKNPADRFQTAADFREALLEVGRSLEDSSGTKTTMVPGNSAVQHVERVPTRASESRSSATGLEMAYVLFMDIVAYSNLPMDRQSERISELVDIVRNTQEFVQAQEANQLISLPTGDGMALVFFQNPAAPVLCASEIARKLALHPEVKLRMGVHTGPVYRIPDINTNLNVAGGGINMAQRVMDCGDAGHILVSKAVADVLGQLSDWADYFHDLGEAEVKHGTIVHLVNFCKGDVGNPALPQKLQNTRTQKKQSAALVPVVSGLPARRNAYVAVGGGGLLIALAVFGTMRLAGGKPESPASPAVVNPAPISPPAPVKPSGGGGAISSPLPVEPSGAVPERPAKPKESGPEAVKPGIVPISPPVNPPVAETKPAISPPPAVVIPPPASPAPAPQPGLSAEQKAALQEQRERMALLSGRATAVRSSLDRIERSQSKSGVGLRGDMAAARESMNYLLGEAQSSLAAGDAATAKRNLDLADQKVTILERFLGQ